MRVLIAFFLLIFSLPVLALQLEGNDSRICAPFRGGLVDPAIINSMLQAAQEGNLYRIQGKSSNVGFCVDSAIGRLEAKFKGIQGGIALRREVWGDESQVLVMLDANSLVMEEDFVKNMLKSEHFLDTRAYSKILFVSTRLRWLNNDNAILEGMLTMHGRTRPVRFNLTMSIVPNNNPQTSADVVVTGKSFIRRTDFGMDRLTFLVSDTVELCMRIEASLFKK